jgi:SET domain-containing protein
MDFNSNLLKNIQSESYVSKKVIRKDSPGKGAGLFAVEEIKKNEIVSISGGIIIEASDWAVFREKYGDYAYYIENNFLIAPLNPENPSDDWRMNHCCHPNCGLKGQIVFVALRDILKGEELTFDYAMTESATDYSVDLNCDKENCRKKFTGNDWKNKDIQLKYKGYFSLYIQEKINNS